MSEKISLKQFLMKSGKFERVDDCIKSIREGRATINNKIITNPNYFFNPKNALIRLNNEKLRQIRKLYFLINKPTGYLSQKSGNEKTIYDLIEKPDLAKEEKQSLFAVGRLDKETEGLMILTNDGKISDLLMRPRNKITKRYHAILEKPVSNEHLKLLEKGVIIEIDNLEYKTTKCKIKKIRENEVYISITEGKKRQIRKMFESIGDKIVYLKRVSIGGIELKNLKAGEIKQITREEIMEKLIQ